LQRHFTRKIVTFAPKTDVSLKKKPIKPKKRFEVGFFRRFFWVLLGGFLCGFFIANPVIGKGAIIKLLSSLMHLADVGISAYIGDLCSCFTKLNRYFRGGLTVLPGIPVPPYAFEDPGLIRDLYTLLDWSARAMAVVDGGEPVLVKSYRDAKRFFMEAGTGTAQADFGVRYRFPTSLSCTAYQRWDTRGQVGLKNGIGPLEPSTVIAIINGCLEELRENIGTPRLLWQAFLAPNQSEFPIKKLSWWVLAICDAQQPTWNQLAHRCMWSRPLTGGQPQGRC
jgi:hypothetical protein